MQQILMKGMGISTTTYFDYMLVISPPDDVKETIKSYKDSCEHEIGFYASRFSTAHISIAAQPMQMPMIMRQKLDHYQRYLLRLKPVELNIINFDRFDNGKAGMTIYAKIEMNEDVDKWCRNLEKIFGCNRRIVPHITIAKTIPLVSFKRLWPAFENSEYKHSFIPSGITVLSRPTINISNENWLVFKELPFGR